MKKKQLTLAVLASLALLQSCASTSNAPAKQVIGVKPILSVHHSSERAEDYYQLGRHYQGQQRFDQATEAYRKATSVDPDYAEAYNGLGVVYSQQARYQEALSAFFRALTLRPQAAHIHNNLGYSYFLQGQFADAMSSYETAAALDPSNLKTLNNLGLLYAQTGEVAKSRAMYARAAALRELKSNAAQAVQSEDQPLILRSATRPYSGAQTADILQRSVPLTAGALSAKADLVPAIAHDTAREGPIAVAFPLEDWRGPVGVENPLSENGVMLARTASLDPVDRSAGFSAPTDLLGTAADALIEQSAKEGSALRNPLPGIAPADAAVGVGQTQHVAVTSKEIVLSASLEGQSDPMIKNEIARVSERELPAYEAAASITMPAAAALSGSTVSADAAKIDLALIAASEEGRAQSSLVKLNQGPTPASISALTINDASLSVGKPYRVTVTNGNGVRGIARNTANMLRAKGITVMATLDQKPYKQRLTVVYYREGYKTEAYRLAAMLPIKPIILKRVGMRTHADVALVLGRDSRDIVAMLGTVWPKI